MRYPITTDFLHDQSKNTFSFCVVVNYYIVVCALFLCWFYQGQFWKKDPSSIKQPFRPLLKIRTEVNSLNWKERNKMRIYLFPGTMFGGLKEMYYWRLAKHEQFVFYLFEGEIAQRNKTHRKKEFIFHVIICREKENQVKHFIVLALLLFYYFDIGLNECFAHTCIIVIQCSFGSIR